jgi:hypothetical protein
MPWHTIFLMCLSVPHGTKPFAADLALIRTLSPRYYDGALGALGWIARVCLPEVTWGMLEILWIAEL